MPVTCGNRVRHPGGEPLRHATVAAARACHQAENIWRCEWLVTRLDPEDGEQTLACGGLAWHLPEGRGHTCEHGHEHILGHVRHDEGWDYWPGPETSGPGDISASGPPT